MMREILSLSVALMLAVTSIFAQTPVAVKLWPDGVPDSNGCTGPEYVKDNVLYNVTEPSLIIYPASRSCGKAVIVCPGGGYAQQSADWDRHASLFTDQGITFAILRYRLPNRGHHEIPLNDVLQAVRIMRRHAAEWNINPHGIGVLGGSAGGHLAAMAACFGKAESRPDFQILLYPVISLEERITHMGSRINLLGDNPSAELIEQYSMERQVTADTPRAFIVLAHDDDAVSPLNSIRYYNALLEHGIPATMHIYPTGGHGFGLGEKMPWRDEWLAELGKWMKTF